MLEWELSDTFDSFLVMRSARRLLEKAKSTEHQVLLILWDMCGYEAYRKNTDEGVEPGKLRDGCFY